MSLPLTIDDYRKRCEKLAYLSKALKKRLDKYEKSDFKLVQKLQKKPDYYYSFSSLLIFRKWYIMNGLSMLQAEMLIVLSYYEYFPNNRLGYFGKNLANLKSAINRLMEMGYVIRVQTPSLNNHFRKGYALTKKGKDLEADYEKHFEGRFAEFAGKKYGKSFHEPFDRSDYFRRERVPKAERRFAQGGGVLQKKAPLNQLFREIHPDGKASI